MAAPFVFLFLALFSGSSFSAEPSSAYSQLGFPDSLPKARLRGFLQDFVNAAYRVGFERLGDEHDFDHGHLLLSETGEGAAILYHTQELIRKSSLNPKARNWLQWLDGTGRVEDASRYVRREYPATPSWVWFKERELPGLQSYNTVTSKMLDPELLGMKVERSMQWTFTRVRCDSAAARAFKDANSNLIEIFLPKNTRVCLQLDS